MHWLFWLSLIPAVTAWMGEHQFHRVPVATYGCVVLMTGIAYRVLVRVLVASQGDDSELARTTRNDMKSRLSFAAYLLAIPLAFVAEWLTIVIFFAVSVAWLLPDKRLELIAKE